jgi:hypothetical protein
VQPLSYSPCHLLSRWFLAQFIFSTLKMEAIYSSETSVDIERTTRRYIPEAGTLNIGLYFRIEINSASSLPVQFSGTPGTASRPLPVRGGGCGGGGAPCSKRRDSCGVQ